MNANNEKNIDLEIPTLDVVARNDSDKESNTNDYSLYSTSIIITLISIKSANQACLLTNNIYHTDKDNSSIDDSDSNDDEEP